MWTVIFAGAIALSSTFAFPFVSDKTVGSFNSKYSCERSLINWANQDPDVTWNADVGIVIWYDTLDDGTPVTNTASCAQVNPR